MKVWNPDYSVGNDILDRQHQKLLALCNQAVDCLEDESPEGRGQFHLILNDLVAYADEHFLTEENLLREKNYPQLSEQKAEHHFYLERISQFLYSASEGNIDKTGLCKYLSNWWSSHILESDMQYKEFLQKNIQKG
jgi:hemerythrin